MFQWEKEIVQMKLVRDKTENKLVNTLTNPKHKKQITGSSINNS